MESYELPLSQGFTAIIDATDRDRVLALGKWQASICGGHVYAGHATNRTVVRLHNFITGWSYVDHISGDGLDNRRANLREATPSLNNANQRLSSANKTGFKGAAAVEVFGEFARTNFGPTGVAS